MEFRDVLAIISVIPAIAWLVAASRKLYVLYQKHEVEIKEKVVKTAEKLDETVEKAKNKIPLGSKDEPSEP